MMFVLGMMVVSPMVVDAADTKKVSTKKAEDSSEGLVKPDTPKGIKDNTDLKAMLKIVIEAILYIIGTLSLLMIVIGGVIYVTAGDSGRADMAKAYITYAIIGLVVALVGLSIINLVIDKLGATT